MIKGVLPLPPTVRLPTTITGTGHNIFLDNRRNRRRLMAAIPRKTQDKGNSNNVHEGERYQAWVRIRIVLLHKFKVYGLIMTVILSVDNDCRGNILSTQVPI